MDQFNEFIEKLLNEKGLPELTPEVKSQLVSDLTDRLMDFINRRLVESLDDKQLEEFNKLLDEQPVNSEKLQNFIDDNVKDKEQIATAAMLEFRALYLGDKA